MSTALLINNLKQNIIQTVNESGLPPCVVELIFSELHGQIKEYARQELAAATEQEQPQEADKND